MIRTRMRLRGAGLAMAAALACAGAAPVAGQALEKDDALLETAQNLVDVCAATGSDALSVKARVLCHGYLTGAMQFHTALTSTGKFTPMSCPTAMPTRRQLGAVLVSWAAKRTDLATMTPIEALMRAAKAEWPCK